MWQALGEQHVGTIRLSGGSGSKAGVASARGAACRDNSAGKWCQEKARRASMRWGMPAPQVVTAAKHDCSAQRRRRAGELQLLYGEGEPGEAARRTTRPTPVRATANRRGPAAHWHRRRSRHVAHRLTNTGRTTTACTANTPPSATQIGMGGEKLALSSSSAAVKKQAVPSSRGAPSSITSQALSRHASLCSAKNSSRVSCSRQGRQPGSGCRISESENLLFCFRKSCFDVY